MILATLVYLITVAFVALVCKTLFSGGLTGLQFFLISLLTIGGAWVGTKTAQDIAVTSDY